MFIIVEKGEGLLRFPGLLQVETAFRLLSADSLAVELQGLHGGADIRV